MTKIFLNAKKKRLINMDELRALRHKRALELLEKPGMRDLFRKNFNFTAYKEWEEAGKPFEEDEEILGIYNHL
jgi:hypothetical protein